MRKILFAVLLLSGSAFASDVDELIQVLQANFSACNDEDIEALMETCSVDMPDRPGFRRESEILFREKDIHYSLVDFRVTRNDGDYAEAWVVQTTHADDRSSDDERREWFRNGTTLLPKEECVEYMVSFKKDGKDWKCLATISEPVPHKRAKVAK